MNNIVANLGKLSKINSKSNSKPNSKAKALPILKSKKFLKIATKTGVFIAILGILGLGSWRVTLATSGKILPKVKIANLKVGGKTPAEAKTIVKGYISGLNAKGPQIVYDNQAINPKLDEMGVNFNVDKVVSDAYSVGRSGSFKTRLFDNVKMVITNYNVSINPQINEQKLDGFLSQIAQVVEIAPVNTGLTIQNGVVSVTPEKTGRGLDKNKLKSDLTNLINQNQTTGKITLVTTNLTPDIVQSGTTNAKVQAEKYILSAPINVTYNEQTFTADKADVGSWIDFSASGHNLTASVSDSKVGGFANDVASKIEVPKIDREVMDGTGEVLNEGQDGIGVDANRLKNDLKSRVLASTVGNSIAVATFPIPKGQITKNPHAQAGRYAGHYVDINLSEQTLYAFEGTKLVNQFLISSGISSHPTPTGEYSVYSKSRVTEMKGDGYDLPGVEWVSWWSGDYSIHGTYWHHNFGTPMSHGCINASNEDAQWIYNWDEVGTPVYVHY